MHQSCALPTLRVHLHTLPSCLINLMSLLRSLQLADKLTDEKADITKVMRKNVHIDKQALITVRSPSFTLSSSCVLMRHIHMHIFLYTWPLTRHTSLA